MKLRKLLSLVLVAVMLMGCTTVTAFADGTSAYLDLETSDTYADSKDIDQNYTFTQASEEYTDVTKVKLEWTISDIAAIYKSHKTWDPDTLTWKETKEDIAVTNEGASFTLTNYSSKNVSAKAEFKVEDALKDTFDKATFENNECIVSTPVVKNTTTTYQDSDFTALAETITATLTLKKDAFADLSATTSATKYGTYTITLAEKKDATVTAPTTKTTGLTYSNSELELVTAGTTDGGEWQYKLGDGEYSTTVPKAKDAGTYTVYYKLVGGDNYNDIAEASVQVTITPKSLSNGMIANISAQTYTGSALTPDVTVKDGETTLTKDTDYTVSYTNNKDAGTATVTITGKGNYTGTASKDFTTNKATQTAPAAPTLASKTSSSVTLTAVSTSGQGDTKYGYNTTNTAPSSWQDSVEFTGLEPETTYYFFAKYVGNTNYNEAVSEGTEIKTSAVLTYTAIKRTVEICSASGNVTFVPVFAENGLSDVMGSAKFVYQTGENTYADLDVSNVKTMADLRNKMNSVPEYNGVSGIANVYVCGTPDKPFYGTIYGYPGTYDDNHFSWNDIFNPASSGASTVKTDVIKQLADQNLITVYQDNTYASNWDFTNSLPILNGISYDAVRTGWTGSIVSVELWSCSVCDDSKAYYCEDGGDGWEFGTHSKDSASRSIVIELFNK